MELASTAAPVKEPRSSRDAPNHPANNPLFQRTSTRASRGFRLPRAFAPPSRRISRFMALHPLRIVRVRATTRFFRPRPARTDSRLTLRSDRFPPDRMNGAGLRRPGAPSAAAWFENQASAAATNVKVEHTRERRVAPHTGGFEAPVPALGGPRAVEHRLPGWESSSRSTGRSDPTKLRHEAREACSDRERAPLSDSATTGRPGVAPARLVPRGPPSTCRANGEAVERNPDAFPPLGTATLHRGPPPAPTEPAAASIFHVGEGVP